MITAESGPLRVHSVYQDFVADGSRKVNTEILAGLHTGFDQQHAVLAIHDSVRHDGVNQPMQENRFHQDLVEVGIPVTTLGRKGTTQRSDDSPYTDQELERAAQYLRSAQTIASLEEHPLGLVNQLDQANTPPLVTFLYRTAPSESPHLPHLKQAVSTGRIAMCVVDSEAAGRVYQEVGVSQSLITVIPNGVDLERFTPSAEKRQTIRTELAIPADAPTVLYVARFSDEKDVPLFMESARTYLANQPDGYIIMVGAGLSGDNPDLTELVNRHFDGDTNLTNRLRALGLRRDIDALHAAADVVALTSRTESYPLCLLEGMAAGAVPVSTDVGDARIMLEGRGIIVPRDPGAIATAWHEAFSRRQELAIGPQQRESLGKQRMLKACALLLQQVARG